MAQQQRSRRSTLSAHTADAARSARDLTQYEAQQHALAQAVRDGKLWMDAEVAEEAVARCEAFAAELREWLGSSHLRNTTPVYGDDDAAEAYTACGEAYADQIERFVTVIARMADTYREAGGLDSRTGTANGSP